MAIGINGTPSRGFAPYDVTNSNLAGAFFTYRSNLLKSANDQLRYQIQWFNGNSLTEGVEPSKNNWIGTSLDDPNGSGDEAQLLRQAKDRGIASKWRSTSRGVRGGRSRSSVVRKRMRQARVRRLRRLLSHLYSDHRQEARTAVQKDARTQRPELSATGRGGAGGRRRAS